MLETPHLVEDVRDALANVLGSAADGKPPADIGGADWGQQLGSMLTLYAGTTQTWNAANRFRADGGHFIVLNYRRAGQLSGRLRPFAIPSFEGIIPAEQFDAMVAKVIATDKLNHPEWLSA